MQTIPSVYSLIDSLLPTWTVYPLTNELCLPDLTFSAVLICLVTCLPPALTTCPNTVYDSALSTLFLTLECDLCLFDLFGDLIKLHMDLNDTASALQTDFEAGKRECEEIEQMFVFNYLYFIYNTI